MKVSVTQFNSFESRSRTVYNSGLTAIHEAELLGYSRKIAGDVFSCYEWSYSRIAHKVTVTKKGHAIIVENVA